MGLRARPVQLDLHVRAERRGAGEPHVRAGAAALVWNTATPSGYQTQAKEFHSSVGSWSLDKSGTIDSAGTANWPSLTPAGTGELYWGYIGATFLIQAGARG